MKWTRMQSDEIRLLLEEEDFNCIPSDYDNETEEEWEERDATFNNTAIAPDTSNNIQVSIVKDFSSPEENILC